MQVLIKRNNGPCFKNVDCFKINPVWLFLGNIIKKCVPGNTILKNETYPNLRSSLLVLLTKMGEKRIIAMITFFSTAEMRQLKIEQYEKILSFIYTIISIVSCTKEEPLSRQEDQIPIDWNTELKKSE